MRGILAGKIIKKELDKFQAIIAETVREIIQKRNLHTKRDMTMLVKSIGEEVELVNFPPVALAIVGAMAEEKKDLSYVRHFIKAFGKYRGKVGLEYAREIREACARLGYTEIDLDQPGA